MSSSPDAKQPAMVPRNRHHSDLDASIAEAEALYHG